MFKYVCCVSSNDKSIDIFNQKTLDQQKILIGFQQFQTTNWLVDRQRKRNEDSFVVELLPFCEQ
jgi:hypothetical protein